MGIIERMSRRRWNHRAVPQKRAEGKIKKRLTVLALVAAAALAMAGYGYYRFDRRILPLVLTSMDMRLKTAINNIIYAEIQAIMSARGVTAADFYTKVPDLDGKGQILAVNTVLVNDICNAAALAISEKLSALPPEPVSVPYAMALGLDTLANVGPRFTFNLSPKGNALVDYSSSFEAVGINQVHFEVWLTVVSTIRVVNPSQSATVTVTREVSLVDTVLSGTVPDTYLMLEGADLIR